mmetsp:Transcript_23931/g.36879  ORF Transcript_23931/g.36879 Transcript_23931/m.36879 type:complete len:112 (+) Transcript_23931:4-339(+)
MCMIDKSFAHSIHHLSGSRVGLTSVSSSSDCVTDLNHHRQKTKITTVPQSLSLVKQQQQQQPPYIKLTHHDEATNTRRSPSCWGTKRPRVCTNLHVSFKNSSNSNDNRGTR